MGEKQILKDTLSSLTLVIGLPGSGKTTVAEKCREVVPNTVLVSRDGLREEFFGDYTDFSSQQEALVTSVAEKMVDKALEQGRNVVIHDMNLRKSYRKQWARFAVKHGAHFDYIDLTDVPLADCLKRNELRGLSGGRFVHPDIIVSNHKRYLSNKQPLETPESLVEALKDTVQGHDPVEWIPGLPEAIIVDIDGTVASHEGVRDPYDTTKYHLDNPKQEVIDIVQEQAYDLERLVLFVSGRDAAFYNVTAEWLYDNVKVPIEGLFMRPEGDTRRDDIVKLELFNNHIRGKYNIRFVLDDRDRVVKGWRSIKLLTLQVAEGNF